jgi:hypothetical protein
MVFKSSQLDAIIFVDYFATLTLDFFLINPIPLDLLRNHIHKMQVHKGDHAFLSGFGPKYVLRVTEHMYSTLHPCGRTHSHWLN